METLRSCFKQKPFIIAGPCRNSLQCLREQIDEVDTELVEVLARRLSIVDEIRSNKKRII